MMSNHHHFHLKQNILQSQDRGPICNMGRGVEVLSASASVSPPPPPPGTPLKPAAPSWQTVRDDLSQGPALAPTGSTVTALELRLRAAPSPLRGLHSLACPPCCSLSIRALHGQTCLPACTHSRLPAHLPLPAAWEPRHRPSSAVLTCANQRSLSHLRLPGRSLSYINSDHTIIIN